MSHPVDESLARIEARFRSLQAELERTQAERDRLAAECEQLQADLAAAQAEIATRPMTEQPADGPLLSDADWHRLVMDGR